MKKILLVLITVLLVLFILLILLTNLLKKKNLVVEKKRPLPTLTQQEIDFRMAIRDRLVQSGYPAQNISLAWMESREPTPQDGLRDLLRQDVEMVLVYSSSISAEGIHSAYEIPEMLSEVELPSGVRLINLGAWNDHPLALQAIAERIQACLSDQSFIGEKK